MASRYIFFRTGTPIAVLVTGNVCQPLSTAWAASWLSLVKRTGTMKGFSWDQFRSVRFLTKLRSSRFAHVVNNVSKGRALPSTMAVLKASVEDQTVAFRLLLLKTGTKEGLGRGEVRSEREGWRMRGKMSMEGLTSVAR